MSTATITSKGQITIPVDIRTKLGLDSGDKINFVQDGDKVLFMPATKNIQSLKGIVSKPSKPVTIEEMKASIKAKGGQV